ncbi:MAG: pyruvate kinase [Bacteroidales bacterium]|nr:pyruvate kinase [Bacteroidales bacterium]MCF6341517.1 pyruvate kinase [Bacteroidales bacterium]
MRDRTFSMTKIIATLGPATSSLAVIKELIAAGVRVFRLNFSHGTFDEFDELVKIIRKSAEETGIFVALLGDLSGPKIRVGQVIKEGVMLNAGDEIQLVKSPVVGGTEGNEFRFSTTYPKLIDEVKPGEKILLDDGSIELRCVSRTGSAEDPVLRCKVINGNLLLSSKGINLPDTELSFPSMTEKDLRCLAYAVEQKFDFIALSFVRKAEDVRVLKRHLTRLRARPDGLEITGGDLGFSTIFEDNYIPVISKIEKPQAIDNLDEIIEESDAIMVARGDLGVEMDLAEVAILQKLIISKCRQHMKPVIVATQMLQSMIHEAAPTRAEVSDVANAIMDKVDAVMLSGETAVGNHPVETVKMMSRIAGKTNDFLKQSLSKRGKYMPYEGLLNSKEAMARGVNMMARDIQAKYIITWSHSGGSSVLLSQQRIQMPIITFAENTSRLQQLSLVYSIQPVLMKQPESGSKFIAEIDEILIGNQWAEKGDPVIVIASSPISKRGLTNRVVIHYIGESLVE